MKPSPSRSGAFKHAALSIRGLLAAMAFLAMFTVPAAAQDSVSLASKSIAQVYAVKNRAFVFAEGGATFSMLINLSGTTEVATRSWSWDGGAEGGAPWGESLLLRANYWISDSQRVARVTSLRYEGRFRGGDSLIFRDPTDTTLPIADGARLTALAVRDSSGSNPAVAVMGFGRLGIAYATLAPETGGGTNPPLFDAADTTVNFLAFPSQSDTALALYSCRWNRLCRVDSLTGLPARDSVIDVAIDFTHPDTAWLLIATDKGLRRGLWGGTVFPYVNLPGIDSNGATVRSVFTAPARNLHNLTWAFTGSRFFFSDDHGATFRVPPTVPGVTFEPEDLIGYSDKRPPHAAFSGDTTFINFNLDRPGLVAFRRDTILANNGTDLGQVLIDTADGLDISRDEGELTQLAVLQTGPRVLIAGSTFKGVFFKLLYPPAAAFTNLNRLKVLKASLGEVITYPTLLTESANCGDAHVRLGYRLKKDARVTIIVYNYAMEKVRVIRRNAPRRGGIARSENLAEDRWDGCDDSGRFVSVGTYYILVESDNGEKAFGKALITRGRK